MGRPSLGRTLTARPKGGERQPSSTWRIGVDPFAYRWPLVENWLRAEADIAAKALMQRLRGQLSIVERLSQWRATAYKDRVPLIWSNCEPGRAFWHWAQYTGHSLAPSRKS
jgi:hypothetical protein